MRSFSSVSVRRISACARQEHQHRARIGAQRARHRVGDLALDRRARVAAEIARLDREGAALALDHRRVAEQLRDARAVERRRHHQQLEIVAQALLRVAREREAEIGVERALVEFVEQHRGDAVERRIVEDQPGEDALGDDLDAGLARHLGAEAHPQARRCRRRSRRASPPSARPRRAPRAGAAPAPGFSCPPPTARRSAPAARAWSCRRPAARPARRHGAAAAPRSAPAAPRRSASVRTNHRACLTTTQSGGMSSAYAEWHREACVRAWRLVRRRCARLLGSTGLSAGRRSRR